MGAQARARAWLRRPCGTRTLAVWSLAASVWSASFAATIIGLCAPAQAQSNAGRSKKYGAPVDGPVIRHYEQPPGPYAKGHRGIDYGVSSGTPVRASNAGAVIFAGPVADDGLFITVRHPDGLETLYSYLSRIDVGSGTDVAKGQQIGLSGSGHPGSGTDALHFAMKDKGDYIDPEPVLRGDHDDISDALALVPVETGPGQSEPHGETSGYQGGYFGNSSGAGPGFTTSPGGGRAGDASTSPYATRGGKPGEIRGSKFRADQKGINSSWGSGGFEGDGFDYGDSWRGKSQRIGRFLAGHEDSEPSSRQAADRAKAGKKRSTKTAAPARPTNKTGRTWPSAMGTAVGAFFARSADAVRTWALTQIDRISPFAISQWQKFKLWLAKQADHIGDFVSPPENSGWEVFLNGLTAGFFHQIGCSLRGGDPPPKMPTAQQFRSGEMKPPPAPNDNIVMVIGGLGSSSTEKNGKVTGHASLFDVDFRTLGFAEEQIYHYSYKGIEKRAGNDPYRIHAPYQKEDTYKSIRTSARALEDQIKEISRQNPGKKVDLVAHSEGGLVAQYFVSNLYRESLDHPKLGHLITLNSPHQGADLARMGDLFTSTLTGRLAKKPAEAVFGRLVGAPPASAPVLGELEESSIFMKALKAAQDRRKVKTTTISTAWDWIVTAPHATVPQSEHYTTNLEGLTFSNMFKAHSEAATAESTKGLTYNALADRQSRCTAFRNSFGRYVSGPLISTAQDVTILATKLQFMSMDWGASMGRTP